MLQAISLSHLPLFFKTNVLLAEFQLGKAVENVALGFIFGKKRLAQKMFKKNLKLLGGKIHHKQSQNTNWLPQNFVAN